MKNKKDTNKLLIISSSIFIGLAVFLFAIQHFFIAGQEEPMVKVYIANKEIKAYDALTADMFTATLIPKDGTVQIVKEHITDVTQFANTFANSNIHKGEILSNSRLINNNDEKGLDYTILLDAPYLGDVAYGDNVKIYAMDSVNGSIDVLFKRKKVYKSKSVVTAEVSQEDVATQEATGSDYEAVSSMYIKVSGNELKQYYNLKKTKELIVVPINGDAIDTTSNGTNVKEPVVEEESTVNSNQTVNHVVTGTDETLGTIAKKYSVTPQELIKLNSSIDSTDKVLSKGTEVKVPSSMNTEE